MLYDIFLFDADGTLFDFKRAQSNALKIMFDSYNLYYSDEILNKYSGFNNDAWTSFEKGEITKKELQLVRFKRLFDYIGVTLDAAEFNAKYIVELGKGVFLLDGAEEICKKVCDAGKSIYIVTNGVAVTQKLRLENSRIWQYVSGLFISEDIGFQKPQKEYFDFVIEHIQPADKSKAIIIGDSLSADIAGGNNAGIDSCWINYAGIKNKTGIKPTYEISSLSEIETMFIQLPLKKPDK